MANDKPVKLYKLLSGSITRYEGAENKEGARKVVTYESDGSAAGNQVWLTEREVQAVGLKKLEEVYGAVNDHDHDAGKIAAPPAATSLTGAPAGGPEEGEGEGDTGTSDDGGGVNVGDAMAATPATSTSGVSTNPAVARVLAKKAADTK